MYAKITAFVSKIQRPFSLARSSMSNKTHVCKKTPYRILCSIGLALICGHSSAQSQAQIQQQIFKNHFRNWYQVEIIIFERSQRSSPDAESWPKNVSLAYPAKLQYLSNKEDADNKRDANNGSDTPAQNDVNQQFRRQLEQPFVSLDQQLRSMNSEARRLRRNASMRVLFHETWRQPIIDKKNAAAIVMHAGDTFGENSELEGSITLHVSRYLHIETNLWMTKFEANFGQESEHWPILPRQPTLSDLQAIELSELAHADSQDGSAVNGREANDDAGNINGDNNWDISFNNATLASNDQLSSDSLSDYTNITQKPYVVKHLVTMKQKRRMRSGELHYLDHPRLGLLIRIDKYKPNMPQNLTNSQGL